MRILGFLAYLFTNEVFVSYIIVMLISALIAVLELIMTFKGYPERALKSKWARWSVLLNALSGALVMYILLNVVKVDIDPVALSLSVGFGFQAFIRTNFVIARENLGKASDKDFNINIGWVYQQLQDFFRLQIEKQIADEKQKLHQKILKEFPDVTELKNFALELIHQLSLPQPDQIDKFHNYIEKVVSNPNYSKNLKHLVLANFILEKGGIGYIESLLKDKKRGNRK